MLKQRVISSLVLAPSALLAAYLGSLVFALVLAALAILLAWEWERLCAGRFGPAGAIVAGATGLAALMALTMPGQALSVVVIGAFLAGLVAVLAGSPRIWWMSAGTLYIGVPLVAVAWLRALPDGGRELLFWLLLAVWATDIGAYAAGRLIGGPLLAPSISPKKTWAGLIGGVLCAALVGFAMAALTRHGTATMVLVSMLLAVVAQLGDLAESAVKRHFGVKDSGTLIPGHGGLFDRLDGLLAAAPALAVVMLAGGGAIEWR